MRKIGFFALAMVLALGTLGVGYAAWTDTLTIEGTVETGDVDINIVGYSGTWVFKNTITDELIKRTVPLRLGTHEVLIAYAKAEAGADDEAIFTYWNLFPSIDFVADILIHYDGSIPAKVTVADITTNDAWLQALWASGDAYITAYWSDINHTKGAVIADPIGLQLHESNYILIELTIHLPQDNSLMGLSGSFTGEISVIQWNEFIN